jgi:hypothetical protein
MQQRQPRLGDILDDYCPRERRVTNHAVVAMVGQDVKQTRCSTCDAEHEYKNAKVPSQRKKKTGPSALYDEVLTGMPRKLAPVAGSPPEASRPETDEDVEPAAPSALVAPVAIRAAVPEVVEPAPPLSAPGAAPASDEHEGPVHRQLIRATLPRTEGQVKERPIPEFTARTAAMRPGRFRPHGGGQGQGHGQGQQRARGGHGPAANGNQPGSGFGRRGPGHRQFASAGSSGPGNRTQAPQGERQGHRRSGRKRSK